MLHYKLFDIDMKDSQARNLYRDQLLQSIQLKAEQWQKVKLALKLNPVVIMLLSLASNKQVAKTMTLYGF